jgi:hypothetical protein
MKRKGVHRPSQELGQHAVYKLMTLDASLAGKPFCDEDHLEVGLGVNRHVMAMALIFDR